MQLSQLMIHELYFTPAPLLILRRSHFSFSVSQNLQALLEAKLRYEESVNGGIMISGGSGLGTRGDSAGYGSRGNSANYGPGPGAGSRNNSLGPGRGADVMSFDED
jgi:hypothetical protein